MYHTRLYRLIIGVIVVWILIGFAGQIGEAASHKVLVVMSYHDTYPWGMAIKEGIEEVLPDNWTIKYVYLDTKRNMEGGKAKAQEAYALYEDFQPEGVIAADDNAQSMFVVPYLKDKVDIPVVFCGVNSDPEEYGYPTSHVTGVLERAHFLQSVIFLQQLVPSVKTLGFVVRDSPTGRGVVQQAQRELATYSGISVVFKLPKTLDEAITATEEFKTQSDGLYITFMDGLQDATGASLSDKDVAPLLVKTFGKPTCSDWRPIVEYGALCGVITTGKEQGTTAAEMLVKAINGIPVSELPITQDKKGGRVLNVTTMKALGLKPKPHILKGVEFVETIE